MDTIPAAASYPEARAIAAQMLPMDGKYHPAIGPAWIERGQTMLAPILLALAGQGRNVTRAELAEIVTDPAGRAALLAATMQGQSITEVTAKSPPEQWGIVREMLEAVTPPANSLKALF